MYRVFITGSCSRHIFFSPWHWNHFSSPGYPNCYLNNKDCTWLLETYDGYYIYLEFYNFHLQYGGSYCAYDFVEIYDGSSLSSPLVGRACGQLGQRFFFYSSGRFLLVRFHSDNSIQMPGFLAWYHADSYSKKSCSTFVFTFSV